MSGETVVLGGGLAGASAALELARAGKPVRLLERERAAHHKVCGEFVSVEVQRDLTRLGVDLAALGGVPIDRVRLVGRGRTFEALLPFTAMGVSRATLDEALLEAAQREGAVVERGVRVTGIDGGDVTTRSGQRGAGRIFLATGKHDVRGMSRPATSGDKAYIGFKMHWRIRPPVAREVGSAVELALFDGGYVGIQRVAPDVLNMSLLVSAVRFLEAGSQWNGLLRELLKVEHVARRVGDAVPLFERPLTIANLPYGFVHHPASQVPGHVYRLGDQVGLTAPLTGDGMAIATSSARIAVACHDAGLSAAEYHRRIRQVVVPQIRRAMMLQRLAGMPVALPVAMGVLGLWPALLGKLAGLTRIVERRPT